MPKAGMQTPIDDIPLKAHPDIHLIYIEIMWDIAMLSSHKRV